MPLDAGMTAAVPYAERMTTGGGPSPDAVTAAVTARKRPVGAWFRKTADRVPTAWFGMILTVIFLAVTAAFGSLETAPTPPTPVAEPGERVEADGLAVTMVSGWVADASEERHLVKKDGRRLVFATVVLENLEDFPMSVGSGLGDLQTGVVGGVGALTLDAPGVDQNAVGVSREARWQAAPPVLQPRVPVEVEINWWVPEGALVDGAAPFTVWNREVSRGTSIASERTLFLNRTTAAATISVPLEDRGADG